MPDIVTQDESYALVVIAGSDFDETVYYMDDDGNLLDFSGWDVVGQVRTSPTGPLLAAFEVAATPLDGRIDLHLDYTVTANFSGDAVYEVQFRRPENRVTLLRGPVYVESGVAR